MNIPQKIQAGDTISWTDSLNEYSAADGWTLTYYLAGGNVISILSAPSGSDFLITIDATVSAAWAPGQYDYLAEVSKSGVKTTVERGTIEIIADLRSATTSYDRRSHAEKILEAIKALEAGRATKEEEEYTIGSGMGQRQLRHLSPTELLKLRRLYELEVEQERQQKLIDAGEDPGNSILIQFSS